MTVHSFDAPAPGPRQTGWDALNKLLADGVTWGDSNLWLPVLPEGSVDLWFTSPPYADARAYSRIHPDHYVEWFLPFGKYMLSATADSGWLVLNIKNRVAKSGPLQGQRHPYVYELVLALQQQGWRWLETYIWSKPNGVPGRFGPRTKDSFEYLYAFAKGLKPYFDLDAIRVPYRTAPEEIERRKLDTLGRRNTDAGFGRDRTRTYLHGGADPGNVCPCRRRTTSIAAPAAIPLPCPRSWPNSSSMLVHRRAEWLSIRSPAPARRRWRRGAWAAGPEVWRSTRNSSMRRAVGCDITCLTTPVRRSDWARSEARGGASRR